MSKRCQAVGFGVADGTTEDGEPVIATSLVVVGDWSIPVLLGEPRIDEPLERPVQRGWSHLDESVRRSLDRLHDRVAVHLAFG